MKALRKYANNFARFAIERDGLADDGTGAPKFLLPKTIGDHCGVWRTGRIILTSEGAAQDWGNAEQGNDAVRNVKSVKALGFSNAGDADGVPVVDANVLKSLILFAIDKVVRRRHVQVGDVDARGGVPDADQFVGVRIGKRFEEDAFENAKDDGVASNAGGESDERNGGEQRSVG